MKKLFGFIVALLLLVVGFIGIYHFYNLEKAKNQFGIAFENYNSNMIEEALNKLDELTENYNYPVAIGYTLLLKGDIYYETGDIRNAIKSYNRIITDNKLFELKNIYYQANIRIARIYRLLLKNKKIDRDSDLIKKKIFELESLLRGNIRITVNNQFPLKNVIYKLESIAFKPEFELPDINESIDQLITEIGYLYFYTGNLKTAEDYFKSAKSEYAKLGLARVYLILEESRKALQILYDIKDFEPDGKLDKSYYDELFRCTNELYNRSFYEEAIFYYKKISNKIPNSLYSELSLYSLAKHYYDINDYGKALGYINSLIANSISLKDQDGLMMKGIIMYKTKNYRTALGIFNNILKKYPLTPRRSEVEEWKKLTERAIKYFN